MKTYTLVWEENFNYKGLPNPDVWNIEHGSKWANREVQYYTNGENINVEDGLLTIEARHEIKGDKEYTSSRINTRGKKHFKLGRIAVKAKLPGGRGTWPAIWMLGNGNYRWPECGEIDIMEQVGNEKDMVLSSLHCKTYNHMNNSHYTYKEEINGVCDRFVEYAVDIMSNYLEFFIDGNSFVKFERGEDGKDASHDGWPFDDEFYLIINLAIGGSLGGAVSSEDFPRRLEIKYVKYYNIQEE